MNLTDDQIKLILAFIFAILSYLKLKENSAIGPTYVQLSKIPQKPHQLHQSNFQQPLLSQPQTPNQQQQGQTLEQKIYARYQQLVMEQYQITQTTNQLGIHQKPIPTNLMNMIKSRRYGSDHRSVEKQRENKFDTKGCLRGNQKEPKIFEEIEKTAQSQRKLHRRLKDNNQIKIGLKNRSQTGIRKRRKKQYTKISSDISESQSQIEGKDQRSRSREKYSTSKKK